MQERVIGLASLRHISVARHHRPCEPLSHRGERGLQTRSAVAQRAVLSVAKRHAHEGVSESVAQPIARAQKKPPFLIPETGTNAKGLNPCFDLPSL